MIVGLDFDNTIVCYDEVFYRVALERLIIPPNINRDKVTVLNYLRSINQEDTWTELQSEVYGARMKEALAYPGAIDFLRLSAESGQVLCIISHKTKTPHLGPRYDLHESAREWFRFNNIAQETSGKLTEEQLFFEPTREAKLARIRSLGCDYFIDDLPEVLEHPDFPQAVKRILFDPNNLHESKPTYAKANSWERVAEIVINSTHPKQQRGR